MGIVAVQAGLSSVHDMAVGLFPVKPRAAVALEAGIALGADNGEGASRFEFGVAGLAITLSEWLVLVLSQQPGVVGCMGIVASRTLCVTNGIPGMRLIEHRPCLVAIEAKDGQGLRKQARVVATVHLVAGLTFAVGHRPMLIAAGGPLGNLGVTLLAVHGHRQ
jgi:hypothetical protein